MAKTTKKENMNHPTTQSSISVSNKVVCEDESCIGKIVDNRNRRNEHDQRQEKHLEKMRPPDTSMSICGMDACADERCIGKQ